MTSCRLFGKSVRQLEFSGVNLSERVYQRGLKTPLHDHREALFTFVLAGEYTEIFGDEQRICGRANALFHPGGDKHAEHFGEKGGRLFVANLGESMTKRLQAENRLPSMTVQSGGGQLNEAGSRLYAEFERADSYSESIVEGLLLEIVGISKRISSSKDQAPEPVWLAKADELIEESYSMPLSLDFISEACDVHRIHLAQTFKKFRGIPVGEAIRERRLRKAREQLLFTRTPISEVALNCGFSDQSHLTRLFSKRYGITPRRFRDRV